MITDRLAEASLESCGGNRAYAYRPGHRNRAVTPPPDRPGPCFRNSLPPRRRAGEQPELIQRIYPWSTAVTAEDCHRAIDRRQKDLFSHKHSLRNIPGYRELWWKWLTSVALWACRTDGEVPLAAKLDQMPDDGLYPSTSVCIVPATPPNRISCSSPLPSATATAECPKTKPFATGTSCSLVLSSQPQYVRPPPWKSNCGEETACVPTSGRLRRRPGTRTVPSLRH